MSTTDRISEAQRHISGIAHTLNFLIMYQDLLESLDYETMREKMNGEWDVPYISIGYVSERTVELLVSGNEQRDTMRVLRRAIGGKWDKSGSGSRFYIERHWPGEDGILVRINGKRDEVCQRVVVGTREVHHEAQPAVAEHTETVEEVEWVCGSLLED